MERFYVFIIRNDIWIYFLCGLALIWYGVQLVQSRRLLRRAMFGLEQERGRLIQRTALSAILVVIIIVAGITYVNLQIAPTLPPEMLFPSTPTPNPFSTSFAPPANIGTPQPRETPTLGVAPTVTLRGDSNSGIFDDPEDPNAPTDTPVPTLPPLAESCNTLVNISSPPAGITATGGVTFFGTASAADFNSYDLQALGPQTNGEWLSLLDAPGTEPVLDNILGRYDFANWEPGDYVIRVVVTNPANEEVGQCGVQITVGG
jgi:hypothetical protein